MLAGNSTRSTRARAPGTRRPRGEPSQPGALKLANADRFHDDRESYQAAKHDLVEDLIRRAEAEHA